jgi:hypothetical protein
MRLEEALNQYIATTFGGLGTLFLVGLVVVAVIGFGYALVRR